MSSNEIRNGVEISPKMSSNEIWNGVEISPKKSSNEVWNSVEISLDLPLTDDFKRDKVKTFMRQFILTDETVNTLKILFDQEITDGLKNEKASNLVDISRMTMDVTYFTELFDGTENGEYVVINLNAQNLILALVTVTPGFSLQTIRKYFTIDETVRKSPYIKIFEYLCECLLVFFTENDLLKKPQILGFCTDLPMKQFDIGTAIINYFTTAASEFPLNSYDIRKCFETVLLRERYRDIKFELLTTLSNNMSLLIYTSYIYGPIDVFLNLENDCDLIYREDPKKVLKWKPANSRITDVFIDTELRNFGKSGTLSFMATTFDWSVITAPLSLTQTDKECRLQKFLSEKYIVELIRHILTFLHHDLVYCRLGHVGNLYKVYGISISDILNFLNTENITHALQLLPGGTIGVTHEDALIAKYVCNIVFIRAALLISICLSRIFLRFQKEDFIIAIKCPVLEKYLSFETYIRNFMLVLAPEKKFQIFVVKDDRCLEGAALGTSITQRQQTTK